MTRIIGTVVDISGRNAHGILTVAAPALRRGADDKIVDRISVDLAIVNGTIATHDLDPGPAKLTLDTGGGWQEYVVNIPDTTEIDLYELVRDFIDYDEPVVSQVREYMERAEAAAESADLLPNGGTDGQVLTKSGDGLAWADAPSGGGGGGGIFLDADGVPYFDTTASGGGSIALDADGVPYVTGV